MFQFFERWVDAFPDDRTDRPPAKLLAFAWHYARPVWPALALMAATSAVISVLEVSLFGFLGSLVDWLSSANPETFLADEAWTLAGMAFVILVILPGVAFLHSLVTFQSLAGNFPMRFRWTVHNWLLDQSIAFFQDEFAGRISTKLMQTALALREAIMKLVDIFVYIGVYFTGMLVLVAAADWRLALPFVGWLALYVVMLRYFVPRLGKIAARQADARAAMTGRVVDAYTNISTVKLFAHTEREAVHAKDSMTTFLGTVHSQMRMVTGFQTSLYALNALLLFAVSAFGIGLWVNGLITIGAVAVAVGLVLRLNGMAQWIMWEVAQLFENIGTVQDGMGTFARTHAIEDSSQAKALDVKDGAIRFENVTFAYGKKRGSDRVIKNFSLDIRPGEKVGLVGRSGAGKSTLLNLLLRFYDVEGGRILIDGQDISQVTQTSLRSRIGMVTQDTSLLHRSIRENILYGRPDADPADLERAIARASAGEFIKELVDSHGNRALEAEVGERGVKLSGGQRQRIAIARVMLKDAPILLLDEATSALDSEVEAAIQENLYRLMEGKTVIAVAHRLSTIAALDRLVVLDKGQIIEEGTHGELIAAGGLYSQLWARQAGGFIDPGDEEADGAPARSAAE
ncbi:ABC transporter ATP-binding protein [Consotaella salsifontis]|uniref:ATP-binding cassette, subfamily B, multidrug efflux pump n=1 Tax=Consotaella salsifontis TaxID=1365950 RepID=A0A1T4NXF2_9HYPH|nr:ABC transporter ATP-binding protein [Consotaella salsifontis]SJZ83687.1 ATP-binding cassette, subfamily B, multidrug efflux pump [Consotaella salsifontis]